MAKRNVVKEIRSATRRRFSAEEKIRIVLEGLARQSPGAWSQLAAITLKAQAGGTYSGAGGRRPQDRYSPTTRQPRRQAHQRSCPGRRCGL